MPLTMNSARRNMLQGIEQLQVYLMHWKRCGARKSNLPPYLPVITVTGTGQDIRACIVLVKACENSRYEVDKAGS